MMPTVKYGKAYKGAIDLQALIMRDAQSQTGKELAQLATSYTRLEMLKLRLRMKPAPKPIDVSKPKKSVMPTIE